MDLKTLIANRLNDHLDELRSFIDGLTPEQLTERPSDSHFSLADMALHLMDVQELYIDAVSRILLGERPTFNPSGLDNHSSNNDGIQELRSRLREYDDQRRSLVSLLTALSEEHWKMEGERPDMPHYTLEKCMEELMRHEEYHFFQMYRMLFGVRNPATRS
jgi:uncharacterized damage-inducible protein DinB